jgi:hypothetical protein
MHDRRLMPLVQPVDLPRRQTVPADIRMVDRFLTRGSCGPRHGRD